MVNVKFLNTITKEKNNLLLLVFVLYCILPLLKGRLLLLGFANVFEETFPDNSEIIITVLQSVLYFFLYTELFLEILIQVIVFPAFILFSLYMLEESKEISYKNLVISFVAIEAINLIINSLFIVGNYINLYFNYESFQYVGLKYQLIKLIDFDFNSLIYDVLSKITINVVLYISLIGILLKAIFGIKASNILIVVIYILLLYIFFELLNPIQDVFFNSGNLGA